MNHIPFIPALILSSCLILSGCGGSELGGDRSLQKGQKALAQENYAEAVAAFQKSSDSEASGLLRYASAQLALQEGNYSSAESLFSDLGDFQDSAFMLTYTRARAAESVGSTALDTGDITAGIRSIQEAVSLYGTLPLYRDSSDRARACSEKIYARASALESAGSFSDAAELYASLGAWQDSALRADYCRACSLEAVGSYLEAAALFETIPLFRDASERADSARDSAWQQAQQLMSAGRYQEAMSAFDAMGEYRDAPAQKAACGLQLVSSLLREGKGDEVLDLFDLLEGAGLLREASDDETSSLTAFLSGFLNAWMNAYAGTMNAFFSYGLVQPWLVSGSSLDAGLEAELEALGAPANYSFTFYGCEIKSLHVVADGCYVATVRGSQSIYGPAGLEESEIDYRVLIDSTGGSPLVAALRQLSF